MGLTYSVGTSMEALGASMKLLKWLIIVSLAVLLLLNAAYAGGLFGGAPGQNAAADPGAMQNKLMQMLPEVARTASYSADRTMQMQGGTQAQTISGRVYHAGMNERSEINMQGMQITSITRVDRGVIYSLLPGSNNYMEIAFDPTAGTNESQLDGFKIENRGKAITNGQATTHYHLPKMVTADGSVEADYYLSEQGAPLLSVMNITDNRGNRSTMTIKLDNIHYGPQDVTLFEVPAGYTRLDIGTGANQSGFAGELADSASTLR